MVNKWHLWVGTKPPVGITNPQNKFVSPVQQQLSKGPEY